ncbi:progestin and adipoQ receptor family member VII, a [Thalassophryne amazonica]|uniref:progestin and adipoQ receptor family member VII, a n=1 Tax=Thalassophryne amazonica TaxID=390379 RepID=UPI001470E1F9|nr:progestin and adipoQ receptor family member VII, a [Thalassophryne amazonica]XP_034017197.1 progestin and adipoQ receptor family member VII, a [Thalassophryne amazonica]
MTTMVMERIGRLFISLQQIRQVPRMLTEAAPSMPSTVRDTEVPCHFREQCVYTGYRPLHQNWRYYFLSLFQCHNETINIWTHLLGFLVILVKFCQLAETVDFVTDHHSWPLFMLLTSSLIYTSCSTAAHLLGSKSELSHYVFYSVDYIGVALYQYGSAVAHFYYSIEGSWHSYVQDIFMPTAAVLSCLSCFGCCYGKYCNCTSSMWVRKVHQVVPATLAYAWDISPVFHRFLSWSASSTDPAISFHFGQVALFLSSAFFFTSHVVERCFPGRCDFVGQSHQVFHVLLICCTLAQIHATHLDYLGRMTVYSGLHRSGDAALFVGLYVITAVVCTSIAVFIFRKVKRVLDCKAKSK